MALAIIEAALKSGAEAVHPGYGFLSENADFAQAVSDAGLAWVGPPPAAHPRDGRQVACAQHDDRCGIPVAPGSDTVLGDTGRSTTNAQAAEVANAIGFPIMVKAAAGGGGKGMRLVRTLAELPAAIEAARREALKAFGDDAVYIEKVVERARHVEIQVLADNFGNYIHLGERECSIQRRHQKLIEEAPSIAVSADLRAKMGAIAVRAAQAVGYTNAGTVEFLLDRSGDFYFLEMNTRLQVEHPVTELVTGIDIVKEQLAIASGRKLRWRQEDIRLQGHAIECRINAENPFRDFLPEGGRVTSLSEPHGPGVRLESGIYVGQEISLYYDPMLAKLVVWGETRAEAVLRMRRALDEYRIGGLHTTIPFHQQVMDSTVFQWGQFDTSFLDGPNGFKLAPAPGHDLDQVAAIAAVLAEHERAQQAVILGTPCGDDGVKVSPWKLSGRPGGRGV